METMETTAKILEKFAPQFVALDEAEDTGDAFLSLEDHVRGGYTTSRSLRDLLDAYAQALVRLQEQDWQSIETAPKIEVTSSNRIVSNLDVWSKSRGYVPDCFFDAELNKWVQHTSYIDSDGARRTCFREVEDPTHWRPCPPPPKQEGEK